MTSVHLDTTPLVLAARLAALEKQVKQLTVLERMACRHASRRDADLAEADHRLAAANAEIARLNAVERRAYADLLDENVLLQERIRKALKAGHIADAEDRTDWQRGYRAAAERILHFLSEPDTATNTEERTLPEIEVSVMKALKDVLGDSESGFTLTREEWGKAAQARMDELGVTYTQLRQMALERHFTSTAARKLWVLIGGTLDEEREEPNADPA